jgi:hypothetical protein
VEGTEVKELCAVERLWKTARDSELFVSETEEDKNCAGLNCGRQREFELCVLDKKRIKNSGSRDSSV